MNLNDLFAEAEADALAKTRLELAAEKAAYDALPQSEKDRLAAEAEAKWDAFADACEGPEDEDEDEDEEDEE